MRRALRRAYLRLQGKHPKRPRSPLGRLASMGMDAMLAAGLVAEVRGLLARGAAGNPSVAGAIGYRETIDCLAGRLPEAELAAAIARNTRGLVRKQRTWFKTQLPPHRQVPAATAQVDELFA